MRQRGGQPGHSRLGRESLWSGQLAYAGGIHAPRSTCFPGHSLVAFLAALLLPLLAVTPSQAQAQSLADAARSSSSCTLGPGSGSDIGGRLLADRLTKKWGQPVVIENRPGGDGIVAIGAFVGAHDDHILLFAPSSSFIGASLSARQPAVQAERSRRRSRGCPTPSIAISVPVGLPAKTLKDVVAMARAKPGELNWAGVTGALDIMFEGWLKSIGLDMKKVPYRNPVEAANDLAAGRVQVYEFGLRHRPAADPGRQDQDAGGDQHRAGARPSRTSRPSAEAGYPALTIDGLVGLFGPPTMPMALRERIAADIKEVMDGDAIIKDRLTADRPDSSTRRACRVRQVDRGPARHPGQGRQRPRHQGGQVGGV